jgi:hypothetical protein
MWLLVCYLLAVYWAIFLLCVIPVWLSRELWPVSLAFLVAFHLWSGFTAWAFLLKRPVRVRWGPCETTVSLGAGTTPLQVVQVLYDAFPGLRDYRIDGFCEAADYGPIFPCVYFSQLMLFGFVCMSVWCMFFHRLSGV